jgi:5-methylcytosine-specific restriction protein B
MARDLSLSPFDAVPWAGDQNAPAGLVLERSLATILSAARARRFLSYSGLAEANGVPWAAARRPINAHLWDLVVWGDERGFPMLSAIVVNKHHVATGRMERTTLKGFIGAAERLGRYDRTEPEHFLRAQQEALFAYVAGLP